MRSTDVMVWTRDLGNKNGMGNMVWLSLGTKQMKHRTYGRVEGQKPSTTDLMEIYAWSGVIKSRNIEDMGYLDSNF